MNSEPIVLFFGKIGSAVVSWLVTWFMLFLPYFWLADHVWTDGELPPNWVFLMFIFGSFVGAALVSKATFRFYDRANTNYFANQIMYRATERAERKMQTKYPDIAKHLTKP